MTLITMKRFDFHQLNSDQINKRNLWTRLRDMGLVKQCSMWLVGDILQHDQQFYAGNLTAAAAATW